jgi:hypothetical protein
MAAREPLSAVNAFEPAAIEAMSQAVADACAALRVFSADRGREILTKRIVALARTGVLDATVLCTRVVSQARVSL